MRAEEIEAIKSPDTTTESEDIRNTVRAADEVIGFIYNYRHKIVPELFGDATPDYQAEWHGRNTGEFWGYLDEGNKCQLVAFMRRMDFRP